MLTQPLLDKLTQLRLTAFRAALEEQLHNPQYADLPFEDRLEAACRRPVLSVQDSVPFLLAFTPTRGSRIFSMPSSTKSNPKNLLLLSQPTTKTSVAKPTIIKEICYAYSTAAR